jgi:hypothetical protein
VHRPTRRLADQVAHLTSQLDAVESVLTAARPSCAAGAAPCASDRAGVRRDALRGPGLPRRR